MHKSTLLIVFVALLLGIFTSTKAAESNLEVLFAADKLGAVFKAYRPPNQNVSYPRIFSAYGTSSKGGATSAQDIDKWDVYSSFTSENAEQYLKAHQAQGFFDPVTVVPSTPFQLADMDRNLFKVAEAGVSLEEALKKVGPLSEKDFIVSVQLFWPKASVPLWPFKEFVYFIAIQRYGSPTPETEAICSGVAENGPTGAGVRKCGKS